MMYRHFLNIFFCLCIIFSSFFATFGQSSYSLRVDSEHVLEVNYWTIEDGLPAWNIIDFIMADNKEVWFVSKHGLCRFDGKNSRIYPFSLLPSTPQYMAEDRSGRIWLVSDACHQFEGRIHIFDPVQEKYYSFHELFDLSDADLPPDGQITYLYRVNQDIYLQTAENDLWKYDGVFRKVLSNQNKDRNNKRMLLPSEGPGFWSIEGVYVTYFTGKNLMYLDSTGHIIAQYGYKPYQRYYSLDDKKQSWYQATEPEEESGSPASLFKVQPESGDLIPYHEAQMEGWGNFLRRIPFNAVPNKDGYALSHTANYASLQVFYKEEKIIDDLCELLLQSTGISPSLASCIIVDKNGDFWLPAAGGLLHISLHKNAFNHYLMDKGISCRGVAALSKDSIFITTYSGNFFLNGRNTLPIEFKGVQYGMGMATFDDKIWIGFREHGVSAYDLKDQTTKDYYLPFEHQYKVCEAYDFISIPKGPDLAATKLGIFSLKETTQSLQPFALPDTIVYCFHRQGETLWAGTEYGMWHHPSKAIFPLSGSDKHQVKIFHVYEDQEGIFWLATNVGLIKWEPFSDNIKQYSIQDGLPFNILHSVYADKQGILWISSDNGLISFFPKTEKVTSYFKKDGLPSSEFNFLSHYQDADGNLYFGSIDGLVSFHPDSVKNAFSYNPSLQEVSLLEGYIEWKKSGKKEPLTRAQLAAPVITIPPAAYKLELKLSSPYYRKHQLEYYWRVPSLSESWQLLPSSSLPIYRLPYGTHALELKVQLLGKPEVCSPVSQITLNVPRPFYLK